MPVPLKFISIIGKSDRAVQIYREFYEDKPIKDFLVIIERYETVDEFFENRKTRRQVIIYFPDATDDPVEIMQELGRLVSDPQHKVIVVPREYHLHLATSAIDAGAFDVINYSDRESLRKVVNIAVHAQEVRRGYVEITDLPEDDPFTENTFIGQSEAVMSIYRAIGRVAHSNVPVLITGETGTGKELVARLIHKRSDFKHGPFVAVNCSAIPENLLESELFGYKRGAFTDAVQTKPGKIEMASGGTLFLDEIGELPPKLQVKLLRVIQEREFERLGENVKRKVEARIIAATNRNLEEELKSGNFREDLYFRLSVATIHIPPLRERKEDIPLLIVNFFRKAVKELKRPVRGITAKAVEKMINYSWPGNVRELQNVLYRAVLVARGEYIMAEDVVLGSPMTSGEESGPRIKQLWEVEKNHIKKVLNYTGWNKSLTARLLGISRPCLIQKIKKYGLKPSENMTERKQPNKFSEKVEGEV